MKIDDLREARNMAVTSLGIREAEMSYPLGKTMRLYVRTGRECSRRNGITITDGDHGTFLTDQEAKNLLETLSLLYSKGEA